MLSYKFPVNIRFNSEIADLEAYRFVEIDHANQTVNYASAGGRADAITLSRADLAGDPVQVQFLDDVSKTFLFEAGAAIAKGAEVQVGTSGKGITKTTGETVCYNSYAVTADTMKAMGYGSCLAAGYLESLTLDARGETAIAALTVGTYTEGLKLYVFDKNITLTNAVEVAAVSVPAGAIVLGSQATLKTLIEGDGTGDDGLTKVGLGVTADPDKYGLSAALTANTKINALNTLAPLAAQEDIVIKAADNAGAAVTEKFVAGGIVRVAIYYLALDSLDD